MAEKPATNAAESWTVWKKSSMAFVGSDGFSIFDSNGKLAFRVDNYCRRSKFLLGELLLMDAAGRPLLVLKPQIFSIHNQWKGYRSEEGGCIYITASHKNLIFTMKRRSILKISGGDVEIFVHGSRGEMGESERKELEADYRIEGCFKKRSCKIWGRRGKMAALISRKKVSPLVVLDEDVFTVVVIPGNECELIMAFIVVLDRICN